MLVFVETKLFRIGKQKEINEGDSPTSVGQSKGDKT